MYHPDLDDIKKHRASGNLIPIYREIVADLETPVSAFLKINRGGQSFLLESVEGGQRLARYSFIGTEPFKTLKFNTEHKKNPLADIQKELTRFKTVPLEGLPRFHGGAIGYLSYETATHFEKLPTPDADPLGLPEAFFMLVDSMLVFDHVNHTIKVLSHVRLDGDIEKAYEEATRKIDELVDRLNQPLPVSNKAEPEDATTGFSSNFTQSGFEEAVRKIKQYINAGEAIQVVLSQRLSRPTGVPPFDSLPLTAYYQSFALYVLP